MGPHPHGRRGPCSGYPGQASEGVRAGDGASAWRWAGVPQAPLTGPQPDHLPRGTTTPARISDSLAGGQPGKRGQCVRIRCGPPTPGGRGRARQPGRRATRTSTGRPGRSSLWVSEKGLRPALSHRPKVAGTWEGRCEWPRAARPGMAWERLERPTGTAVAGLGPCEVRSTPATVGPGPQPGRAWGTWTQGSELDGGEAATPEPPPSRRHRSSAENLISRDKTAPAPPAPNFHRAHSQQTVSGVQRGRV